MSFAEKKKKKKKKKKIPRELSVNVVGWSPAISHSDAYDVLGLLIASACCTFHIPKYRNNPKYWQRHSWSWENSLDLDQTPQNPVSDQGLHCLPFIQQPV